MISASQLSLFNKRGYIIFEDLFSDALMCELKSAATQIVHDFDPASTRSIFSTEHADTNRDDYFLSSGNKVRCFFEEDAFNQNGELQQDKVLSINKIGHALHWQVPIFKRFSEATIIANIAKGLGCMHPQIHQSMYIFKQPKIGGVIRWHQDATYFFTKPQSVLTFWLAVEDANLQNGCLQVHSDGAKFPIKEQFKRYQNDETELVPLLDIPWPNNDEAIPLEVKAGSLVVFNGALPHFSEANKSLKSRHAFTLHITSGRCEYDQHNWLRAEPLRIG